MISNHLITQRPPPKVALLALHMLILSTMVASHVLPRQTDSPEPQGLSNTASPPISLALTIATPTAVSTPQPLRQESGRVCGYIGGDPHLQATCLAGSHCAVDVVLGAVGCCPDQGSCKWGIFTGCVDDNSGPQTVADPYIFTCRGRNVCYKNMFAGGYFQYGCGTASGLATTVLPSAPGQPVLKLASVTVQLTATPTPLSKPVALGSDTANIWTTSSIPNGGNPDLDYPAVNHDPQPSTGATTPSSQGSSSRTTAVIIGGTVGGIVFISIMAVLGVLLWHRKSKPRGSSLPDQNQRSMTPGEFRFEPYTSRQEVTEIRALADAPPMNRSSEGPSTETVVRGNDLQQPRRLDTVEEAGSRRIADHKRSSSDHIPLTRDSDESTHEFNSALEGVDLDSDADTQNSETYPGPRRGNDGGILWQQNRRRSRNLVWM
ncbi:hypothetical protein E4U14_002252 [Claviceps sp. LM454 group G7]|nr:hypothetical protein E4U14_002252 [Claviceps sp. LM454 group G7]